MSKDQVIKQFCQLSSKVMDRVFSFSKPADCFCENKESVNYQYSPEVIEFIKQAVQEKLDRQMK